MKIRILKEQVDKPNFNEEFSKFRSKLTENDWVGAREHYKRILDMGSDAAIVARDYARRKTVGDKVRSLYRGRLDRPKSFFEWSRGGGSVYDLPEDLTRVFVDKHMRADLDRLGVHEDWIERAIKKNDIGSLVSRHWDRGEYIKKLGEPIAGRNYAAAVDPGLHGGPLGEQAGLDVGRPQYQQGYVAAKPGVKTGGAAQWAQRPDDPAVVQQLKTELQDAWLDKMDKFDQIERYGSHGVLSRSRQARKFLEQGGHVHPESWRRHANYDHLIRKKIAKAGYPQKIIDIYAKELATMEQLKKDWIFDIQKPGRQTLEGLPGQPHGIAGPGSLKSKFHLYEPMIAHRMNIIQNLILK